MAKNIWLNIWQVFGYFLTNSMVLSKETNLEEYLIQDSVEAGITF